LGDKPLREVLAYADGEAVKLRPEPKRPANRRGKRVYPPAGSSPACVLSGPSSGTNAGRYSPRLCGTRWTLSPGGRPFTSPGKPRRSSKP
jgi:hypothetical protein